MRDRPSETAVLGAVEANRDAHEAFLSELVEINSFTGNKAGVDRVAERLADELSGLGLSHRRFPKAEVGDFHRFDTRSGQPETGAAGLALIGHLDTVFPPDGGFSHFSTEPRDEAQSPDERYLGPGVMDMKGGLTVIVFALRALRDVELDLAALPLTLLFNSDEELGSPHSASWIRGQVRAVNAALVFEGGREGDAVVTCRKGSGRMQVRTAGRAAHAGNRHQDGVNALVQLARVCVELDALTDYDRQLTVNIGVMRGGTAKNVVADAAEALVDFRYLDPDDAARLEAAVRHIEATEFVPGARTRIEFIVARPPMPRSPESLALLERYADAARRVGLQSSEAPLQGGGSDANLVAAEGVPVIDGLGPYGRGLHTHDEWISARSLERKTQALALFLRGWTSGGSE